MAREPTHFLNVDLDLEGRADDVAPLVAELDSHFLQLTVQTRRGRTRASYEPTRQHPTPEGALRATLKVLEKLGEFETRCWYQLKVRDFNIGVQSGRLPHSTELSVAPETLRRIAGLGARLAITIYAPNPRPRSRSASAG